MLSIGKVISSLVDTFRITKYLRFGKNDVQTSVEASPYGIDSAPIKDIRAVVGDTQQKGNTIIIGYIFKEKSAAPGETYLYSTDTDGVMKGIIKIRNSGDIEINGDADNMVRFTELETAYNQLKADFDSLVSTFNTHVHSGVTSGGASTGPTPTSGSPSSGDISGAKIDNVKTN